MAKKPQRLPGQVVNALPALFVRPPGIADNMHYVNRDARTTEQWRPCPSADGYEVSSFGRLRSWRVQGHADLRRDEPKLLSPTYTPAGYAQFRFRTKKRQRLALVHRLVLEAFVGPCPTDHIARHLNGNPSDNRLCNLAWGTREQNARDRHIHAQLWGVPCR